MTTGADSDTVALQWNFSPKRLRNDASNSFG